MAKDVQATLNFIPADSATRSMTGTADFYSHASEKRVVTIHDVRGRQDEFSLSNNGFQFTTHRSVYLPVLDPAVIKSEVYAETAELLKNKYLRPLFVLLGLRNGSVVPPPTHVKVASHTIRSALSDLNSEYTGTPGPARAAHLDHTAAGATNYLYEKLPSDDASRLSRTRWAIINVRRPMKPVRRDPLAICDGSTLQEGDLLPIRMDYSANARARGGNQRLKTTVGWEIAMAKYNERQRWYYLSNMGLADVLLMKIFDSAPAMAKAVAVHSSFEDLDEKDGEVRESIEFRCLVFWEKE
ncbi:uncharacterized protein DSM5745_01394 [Aspergillus mulundensis]|uniref:Uncharacterized protein n=1 Tax=Aspergillus mulundensis TaxID=1810919 RepID=A0A3D8T674_9EURO|nr:hypothetical protein DSM5745_01394 [Aspergillus mulundensis]RDW94072.1 hypothetical protein DSM5745_01394 [Aspergillus mulundensis]